ncbi:MAG: glycoside hydrolase family 20 zincin-like fold domain-containing protein [Planctomycetota bacterium]
MFAACVLVLLASSPRAAEPDPSEDFFPRGTAALPRAVGRQIGSQAGSACAARAQQEPGAIFHAKRGTAPEKELPGELPRELLWGLLPVPQEIIEADGAYRLDRGVQVRYDGENSAAAAARLARRLETWSTHDSTLPLYSIVVGALDPPEPPARAEGSVLDIAATGIALRGFDAPGLNGAIQTLAAMLEDPLFAGELPCVRIRDWPAASWRAVLLDLSGDVTGAEALLRRWLAGLSKLKINTLILRLDGGFAFEGLKISRPGAITKAQVRELRLLAGEHQIQLLPLVDLFDNMQDLLVGPYEALQLPGSEGVIDPRHPTTRPFVEQIVEEITGVFDYPFFHAGFASVPQRGSVPGAITLPVPENAMLDHLAFVQGLLAVRGRRLVIWSDPIKAGLAELGSSTLASGLVAFERRDRHDGSLPGVLASLRRRGVDVVLTTSIGTPDPARGGWHVSRMRLEDELAIALTGGALGGCVQVGPVPTGLFTELSMYGVARAAARLWNGRPLPADAFDRRFARHAFGVDDPALAADLGTMLHFPLPPELARGLTVSGLASRVHGPKAASRLDRWSEECRRMSRQSRRRLAADRALVRRHAEMLECLDISWQAVECAALIWSAPRRAAVSWQEACRLQRAGRGEWREAARTVLAELGELLGEIEELGGALERGVATLGLPATRLVEWRLVRDDLENLVERLGVAVGNAAVGAALPAASSLYLAAPPLTRLGEWWLSDLQPEGSLADLEWDVTALVARKGDYTVIFEGEGENPQFSVRSIGLTGERQGEGLELVPVRGARGETWCFPGIDPSMASSWCLRVTIARAGPGDTMGIVYLACPED